MLANTQNPRRTLKAPLCLAPCLLMLLLTACGGGGSSSPAPAAMAWQEAETLGEKDSLPGGEAQVWQNERGDVLVVWRSGTRLHLRRHETGLGWQPEQELDNNGQDFDAALDGQGNATVIWSGGAGGNAYVRHRDYRSGRGSSSGWQLPNTLAENQMTSSSPKVAMNAKGDRLMAWTQDDNSFCSCSRLWVDMQQGGEARREALTTAYNHSTAPVLGLSSSGHAAVLWRHVEHLNSADTDPYVLFSAYRPAGGNWQPPSKLQNAESPPQPTDAASLALDTEGWLLVLWSRSGRIQASSRENGLWQPIADLGNGSQPRLSTDGTGITLAQWQEGIGVNSRQKLRYREHNLWSAEQEITSPYLVHSATVGAVMDNTLTALVGASFGSTSVAGVLHRPLTGDDWGDITVLGDSSHPATVTGTSNARGQAVIVWQNGNSIMARLYR